LGPIINHRQGETRGKHAEKADTGEEAGDVKTSGTGFFISSDGYLLTSQHVVEGAKTVKVVTGKGIFAATIINFDAANDIAILKVGGGGFGFLDVVASMDVKAGDKVFTMGFPNIGLQGFEPKYTEGVVSSVSGANDNPGYFQISTPVQPGNSGGPLINKDGEVVGIITSKLSEISALLTSGELPQNVNYALKSSYIRAFLEVVPGIGEQESGKSKVKETDISTQINKAKEAVVLILCY